MVPKCPQFGGSTVYGANNPCCSENGHTEPLRASHTLCSSQHLHTRFGAVKTNSATGFVVAKTDSINNYNLATCISAVKMDSTKLYTCIAIVKTDTRNLFKLPTSFYGRQNGLSKLLHAFNSLFGCQNGIHEPPHACNKLYCSQNELHKHLQASLRHCDCKNRLQQPLQEANKLLVQ